MPKRSIKEGSLVRFASQIEKVAEQVFKTGKRSEKLRLIKDLLPYVYRKQPEMNDSPINKDTLAEALLALATREMVSHPGKSLESSEGEGIS